MSTAAVISTAAAVKAAAVVGIAVLLDGDFIFNFPANHKWSILVIVH